jgi:hypothetical protein
MTQHTDFTKVFSSCIISKFQRYTLTVYARKDIAVFPGLIFTKLAHGLVGRDLGEILL